MQDLDSILKVRKIDSGNVLNSIEMFPDQLIQGYDEMQQSSENNKYKKIENIVLSGMGGSSLGARFLKYLFLEHLKIPFEIVNDYKLPNYLSKNTLFIAYSYSGDTEETLSCFTKAIEKGSMVYCITTGGKLLNLAKKYKQNYFHLNPKYNPCQKPRFAVGYAISTLFSLFVKLDIISGRQYDFKKSILKNKEFIEEFSLLNEEKNNLAKHIARKLKGYAPILISSGNLMGSTHIFKNVLNETAKVFSINFDIPELNHHLMEGLKNPALIKQNLKFLFIESALYPDKIKKRFALTKEVVGKNDIDYLTYTLRSNTWLDQALELTVLSLFVSFYLAILYEVDPKDIPWVDYFKKRLM